MGDQVQTKKYQTLIIQNMTQDKKCCYKYETSTTANFILFTTLLLRKKFPQMTEILLGTSEEGKNPKL